ncbi:MAG: NUDIX hydrolase [Candidatus Sumerlaeia bacterium]|nr:NUDIX hydrolase [Candidatus Sumerlaeia bacterium]
MDQTEELYCGEHLRLNKRRGWEYVDRVEVGGVIAVLPLTEQGDFIFIEQYREPLEQRIIEIPAGLMGDEGRSEDSLEAAVLRELEEETGYTSDELYYLTMGPSSAGLTTEVVTYFMAMNCRKVAAGGGVGNEDIQLHVVPALDAANWLHQKEEEGMLVDSKIYTTLYFWLMDNLAEEEDADSDFN